ncbi:Phage-related minor tail protein [Clostridioides difficile]|nr:Phage-related minor tail protein [Clostridioides difficile]CZS08740.1 Phage-related minor tail protein [Clostridioides difficile]
MSDGTRVLQAIIRMRDEASATLRRVAANTRSLHDSTSNASKALNNVQNNLKSVGSTALKTGSAIAAVSGGILALSAKSAIEFESAFAGVKKTVNASDADINTFKKNIMDLSKSMPQTAVEISAVGEAAGQLGIKVGKNASNITNFTKTMVMLGDATNMSSDEAATALARFANIVQMPQKNFDRLGATIVQLGNNLATTESEIVEMALRLAGSGKQVGMSEAQIMSFAGALSSVGIKAEAGGSAFSKVMQQMQLACEMGGSKLNNFAKVAGISASKFKESFQKDAAGAIISFVKGLGDAKKHGNSAIKMLNKMGITEIGMTDALLRASGAGDLFNNAIQLGNDAWKENIALTNEANQRYSTTESQLKMMKNQITQVAIIIGNNLLPFIRSAVQVVSNMANAFSNLPQAFQSTATGILLAVTTFGLLLATVGIVSLVISKAAGLFAFFIPIILRTKVAFRAFTIGMKPLSAVFLAIMGPMGWTIAAIIALSVAFTVAYAKSEVFRNKVNSLVKAFTEFAKPIVSFCMPALKQLEEKFKELLSAFGPLFASILNLGSVIMKVLGPVLIGVIGFHIAKLVVVLSTLATAFKAVVDTITNVLNGLASILNGIFDLIIGIVTGDSKKMMNGVKQIFDGGVKIIKSIWKGFIDFVTAPIQAIADIADSLFKDKAKLLTDKWRDLRTTLENPIEATAKIATKTNVNIPGSKAADAAGKSTPNTGGLKQTMANLKGSFSNFQTYVKPMTDSISQGVESGKAKFTELQNKILNDVKPALKVLEDSGVNFKNKFKESITSIKDKFNELKDILVGNIKTNIDNLVKAFEPLKPHLDNLKECFDKVKKAITDFFTPAKQVGDTVDQVSQPMDNMKKSTDGIKLAFQNLGQALAPVKAWFQGFMPFLSQIGQQLLPAIGIAIAGVVGGIILAFIWFLNTVTAIITTVSGVINGIISFISGIVNVVMGLITGNADQTMDGLKQIFDGGVGIVKSIWNGLVDLVSGILEPVIDLADSFFKDKVKGVKETWNKLKDFFKHPIKGTIEIFKKGPSLQVGKGADAAGTNTRGAFGINRVPKNDYLIRAHEGERLLTKQEANQYKRNSSNGSLFLDKLADTIIVREEADIDKIVKKINKKISIANAGGVL